MAGWWRCWPGRQVDDPRHFLSPVLALISLCLVQGQVAVGWVGWQTAARTGGTDSLGEQQWGEQQGDSWREPELQGICSRDWETQVNVHKSLPMPHLFLQCL